MGELKTAFKAVILFSYRQSNSKLVVFLPVIYLQSEIRKTLLRILKSKITRNPKTAAISIAVTFIRKCI